MPSDAKRRRRGFTLLEVLVAASLSLMVLTLVFQTLLPTMAASTRAAERVELHQKATLLGDRLVADLRESHRSGVGVARSAGRICVSIHARDPATSEALWKSELRVYDWRGKQITGSVATLATAPSAPMIPALSLLDSLPKQERLRIGDVAAFDVVVDAGPAVRVSLALQKEPGGERLEFSRAVFLRNSAD